MLYIANIIILYKQSKMNKKTQKISTNDPNKPTTIDRVLMQ